MAKLRKLYAFRYIPRSPLLTTESPDEFNTLCEDLASEFKPQGPIERHYVDEIAHITWEIDRLNGCRSIMINTAFHAALKSLLVKLALHWGPDPNYLLGKPYEQYAVSWFNEPECKSEILGILAGFNLDESAIATEAIRLSSPDLILLDKMLMSLESRLNKTLRCMDEYRHRKSRQPGQSSGRNIQSDDVLHIEHDVSQKLA